MRNTARVCTLALLVTAAQAAGAILSVGAAQTITTISEAARVARDGDVVEIAAGDYRGDVAVWQQHRLTIRGVGGTPVLHADGRIAEGKGIWVIRNGDFMIENVTFEGARARDRNGAGIRFERGKLTVRRCRFTDNENGILTSNAADAELAIEDSEFAHAPRDRGSLKHLLYVGRIARFTLTGSRVHDAFEGHLVKTRARENHIAYNLLYDGAGGQAAYELEFPDGGVAMVIGNVIGQSSTTTNPVVVSYGAEGSAWQRNALYLVNNTLLSDAAGAWFLRVATERFGADLDVVAANNLTVGAGLFSLAAPGRFESNFPVLASALGNPDRLDFRLGAHSVLRETGVAPPTFARTSLTPTAEFKLPVGTMPLPARDRWTPGAFQSLDPQR